MRRRTRSATSQDEAQGCVTLPRFASHKMGPDHHFRGLCAVRILVIITKKKLNFFFQVHDVGGMYCRMYAGRLLRIHA